MSLPEAFRGALAALLVVTLLQSGCEEGTDTHAPLGEFSKDDKILDVEKVFLDDVWPAPEGSENERVAELYVRALTRYNQPVLDLRGDPNVDFSVRDSGEPVDKSKIVVQKLSETHRGVTCVIAIDVSRTMRGDPFERAKAAATKFLDYVEARDRVAIVTFSDEARTPASFQAAGRADVRAALANLQINDESLNTVLYDGIRTAVELIREGKGLPRRAFVIVFSDGIDSGSQNSLDQVIANAQGSETKPPVLIFTIGYARFGTQGLAVLDQISKQTGGTSAQATSTIHISSFFGNVWDQMTKSYVVRYPANMDGEAHKVEIEISGLSASRIVRYPDFPPPLLPFIAVGLGILIAALGALWIVRGRPAGRLIFESGPSEGEVFVVRKQRTSIGALPDNDIMIPLDSVSKYHVMIYRKGRQVEIEDLNSLNGTFVNGTRVRIAPLQSGDRIRIANVDLIYQR